MLLMLLSRTHYNGDFSPPAPLEYRYSQGRHTQFLGGTIDGF